MFRVNVGLSRKVSRDYNSAGFTVNLDGEVTAAVNDPEGVMQQIRELYDLAEEALNQQVERHESETAIASRDEQPPSNHGRAVGIRPSGQANRSNGNGQQQAEPATNKQIQYLLGIGKRQQLTTAQLETEIAQILGHPVGVYELSKRQAGAVIDSLTGGERK